MTAVLLQIAPALLLALVLVLGRYPGERSLEQLRRRVAAVPPAERAPASRWRRRDAAPHHRGLWLATAFSARPPPAG
jgi:hypothetical protein